MNEEVQEIKISEMVEAKALNTDDVVMVIQNGINKKAKIGDIGAVDSLPVGAVIEWFSDTIPNNWLLCDGQAVSRTDYSSLFNVLGTTYGQGDGTTTFNLPNKKGKVAVGKDTNDTDFNVLGKTGGEKEHTLTITEIPAHSHQQYITANNGGNAYRKDYVADEQNLQIYPQCQTGLAGGGQAHNNLQPYVISNFIIKAKQEIKKESRTKMITITTTEEITSYNITDVREIYIEGHLIAEGDYYTVDETKVNFLFTVPVGTEITFKTQEV